MKTKNNFYTMAAKKKSKKELSTSEQVGIGIGLTAAAVAAAGAYFLYGSDNAAKNRKTVKSWALKAKAEVLEQLEDAKKMSREEFEQVVAGVASTYTGAKAASKKDVAGFAAEMMQHWDKLEGAMTKKKKAPAQKKPAAKKTVTKKTAPKKKPVAKKPAKKTAKK